jgi:hypothetical protein
MSIQNVTGADAAGWREPLADTNRMQATGQSGSGGSSMVSELSEEFSALAEMFKGMLSSVASEVETGTTPASSGSAQANTAGSAAEQLLGTRSLAVEQSSPSISLAPASTTAGDSGSAAVGRAPAPSGGNGTDSGTGGSSAAPSAGTSSTPPTFDDTTTGVDPSLTCCTLSQAQSVLAAFPGATLDVWPDNGLPVPASTVSADPNALMPYVINFGANASTGQPELYYASVIYNAGQQALQQTAQGPMNAGDYYVWNTTPDANGVTWTTDVGSSFNQFAQYYMSQINAHQAVDLYQYSPEA